MKLITYEGAIGTPPDPVSTRSVEICHNRDR